MHKAMRSSILKIIPEFPVALVHVKSICIGLQSCPQCCESGAWKFAWAGYASHGCLFLFRGVRSRGPAKAKKSWPSLWRVWSITWTPPTFILKNLKRSSVWNQSWHARVYVSVRCKTCTVFRGLKKNEEDFSKIECGRRVVSLPEQCS